jgi:hypothetical protein
VIKFQQVEITARRRDMKKQLDKETLKKEAILWGKMKNALGRDDIRVCRK